MEILDKKVEFSYSYSWSIPEESLAGRIKDGKNRPCLNKFKSSQ